MVFLNAMSKIWSVVLQSLICDVTVNLSLAKKKKCKGRSEFCQEHSAPFLWSSCELLAALYAHHYLIFHEILLDCWNIFQRRSPMLCMRRTCYFHLYSTWFPGAWYLQHYRFGCGYGSHLEKAARKISLGIHIQTFPHKLFYWECQKVVWRLHVGRKVMKV